MLPGPTARVWRTGLLLSSSANSIATRGNKSTDTLERVGFLRSLEIQRINRYDLPRSSAVSY